MENSCYVEQANNISIFVADWLGEANQTRAGMIAKKTHQMSEVPLYHKL
jgi:hypothetical protein